MSVRKIFLFLLICLLIPITLGVYKISQKKSVSTVYPTMSPTASPTTTTPSQKKGVDLSYIWLYTDKNVNIVVKNASNLPVGEDFIQQPLRDPVNAKLSGKPFKQFLFPKPSSGKYEIILSVLEQQEYKLKALLYDREGNHKTSSFSGILKPNINIIYKIGFDKEDSRNSTIEIQ